MGSPYILKKTDGGFFVMDKRTGHIFDVIKPPIKFEETSPGLFEVTCTFYCEEIEL